MSPPADRIQRAIVVIWDGLRPDLVSAERTPTLAALAAQGASVIRAHAAYPSETRVNTASFICGSWPTAHGIVANEMFHPLVDPDQPFTTGDAANLRRLDQRTDGRLLGVPSLGELLNDAGGSLVVASAGSSGNALLLNHRAASMGDPARLALVHWAFAEPATLAEEIWSRFGPAPAPAIPNTAVCDWLTGIFTRALLPEIWACTTPSIAVLWLSEPDMSQHNRGIGSPEALQALRENDQRLRWLLETLDQLGQPATGPRATSALVVASDHGFASVGGLASLRMSLASAGLLDDEVVVTRSGIYLRHSSRAKRDEIARFLLGQPWVGMVLTRDGQPDGTVPMPLLNVDHSRAPDVAISYAWTDEPNEAGWPGTVQGPVALAGEHGNASPYEMRSTLIVAGPGIGPGLVSDRPAGIVDIAPTLLDLLGLPIPRRWMGRVLRELGPDGVRAGRFGEAQVHEFGTLVDGRPRLQRLHLSRTDAGSYLERADVNRGDGVGRT